MDEYLGLAPHAPQRFGNWLRGALLDRVPVGTAHLIDPGDDPQVTADRYSALLTAAQVDIVCLGIGVNGHLAFNDPPADCADPALVKVVTLDQVSRLQQVGDGCFATLAEVPAQAVTLTIPALLAAAEVFCMVPGAHKKRAVIDALYGPIDGSVPASAVRTHRQCTVYVDKESAPDAR
jgi:glucosamine-6-phosphate deaminase